LSSCLVVSSCLVSRQAGYVADIVAGEAVAVVIGDARGTQAMYVCTQPNAAHWCVAVISWLVGRQVVVWSRSDRAVSPGYKVRCAVEWPGAEHDAVSDRWAKS
jgi:hypothetical protein